MQAILRILNEEFSLDCAPDEQRRLEDLAAALDARLSGFSGDAEGYRRLVLTALSLLDEAQATGAALARARCEIERLNDMVAEARIEQDAPPPLDDRGRVNALRA
jgi:cell division protein ZapA (FtsZ GTPase activity inhibitor)